MVSREMCERISTSRDFSGSHVKGALVEKATDEAVMTDDDTREGCAVGSVGQRMGDRGSPRYLGCSHQNMRLAPVWIDVHLGGPQAVALGHGCGMGLETKRWVPLRFYGNHEGSSTMVVSGPLS